MPIPTTEAGQRTLIRGAIARKSKRFPRGGFMSRARETLAQKIMKQGKSESDAYAIATSIIKKRKNK